MTENGRSGKEAKVNKKKKQLDVLDIHKYICMMFSVVKFLQWDVNPASRFKNSII